MNFTPILQAAAVLLAAVITTFVVPYIKSRTTASQQIQINSWVKIAVAAVEQTCKDVKGAEKKKRVLGWLYQHGIVVNEDQIDAMIEAAVYEIKSSIISVSTGHLISEESEAAHGIS